MNKKCPKCKLDNSVSAHSCTRCNLNFQEVSANKTTKKFAPSILMRIALVLVMCIVAIAGFYFSLIYTSDPLTSAEQETVNRAIQVLREKGFLEEVFYLENFASFRGSDNWLNGSVPKENAYAATNYPFEIMTIYPDFFTYTQDDLERAAILLHEAKHLKGADEKKAYSYVWTNRYKLGWTEENYGTSIIWLNVRLQTQEFAPHLFE